MAKKRLFQRLLLLVSNDFVYYIAKNRKFNSEPGGAKRKRREASQRNQSAVQQSRTNQVACITSQHN